MMSSGEFQRGLKGPLSRDVVAERGMRNQVGETIRDRKGRTGETTAEPESFLGRHGYEQWVGPS